MSSISPQPSPLFREIEREPTLVERVSEQLLAAIVEGGISPGDRLPSERDLADQFGVSRTVIREAVRTLAAKGIIDVRTGSGLRVSSVPASSVTELLRLYLHGQGFLDSAEGDAYDKIDDVRQTLEVHVAGRASENPSPADLEALERALEQMRAVLGDVDAISQADVVFHRTIAQMTHNELFVILLDSISPVLLEIRRRTLGDPGRPQQAIDAHQRILEAIAARDPSAARAAMREHLQDSRAVWRSDGR